MQKSNCDTGLEREFEEVLTSLRYPEERAGELLRGAYEFAKAAHKGQFRLSGEPFISHGLAVARILAELGLDTATIAGGILHDVVEDTGVKLGDVEHRFGKEIAGLVGGLTELGKLAFRSQEERQVESARRLLVSLVQDVRVIFIKLADRLHNMRTLQFLPPPRVESIARETLEIYAPIAHRLGIGKVKDELEDLSFRHLEPEQYRETEMLVNERVVDGEAAFEGFRAPIEKELKRNEITAKIESRVKRVYSVWNKMKRKGIPIDDVYDILSMRIITQSVRDCYHALEIVHGLFNPVQGRFKDYIAAPKSNMYQSLHTTVLNETGRRIEIQIRTESMHYTGEYGIASHWIYKERGKAAASWDKWLDWIKQALDYQLGVTDPVEFLRYLKTDLFQNEIFVFTPQGDLKQLPVGSTPIDFAYAVHSDVGNRCSGARVNGRLVSLENELRSGDRIEIITSQQATPSEKWLAIVRTSHARAKIRQWFRQVNQKREEAAGRELLRKELRRQKLPVPKEETLRALLKSFKKDSIGQLYISIGGGVIASREVARALYPETKKSVRSLDSEQLEHLREFVRRPIKGIRIDGMDNIMVRFARCCQPVPGDPIVGIITRGQGVSVHRAICGNVRRIKEKGRVVGVDWDTYPDQKILVSLVVTARDRDGLVAEISRRVRDLETEVRSGHFEIEEGDLRLVLVVEISDLGHLKRVIDEIGNIDSVVSVRRAV
ncbi:MAG: bifunctional (p)ppGpp synthetase/guanosine-3',5'-bis(diphosphate) 3'-pyrophosphohydrolase [bacterium]|nr:MAG: bifunctional (p)ppGpp synthetase/guanosine-3',5'-bis(diphosphate) 3'-pyrophosphohydrolase [bacterium]